MERYFKKYSTNGGINRDSAKYWILSQTSVLVICHQPDTSVFYFVCSQMPLQNMGRPWNIQEAIYSSTVIWDKNGEKENIWAKWDSREEEYSDIIFSAQPIFEEIRLSRKQVSLYPECKPHLAPWTESMVTAMCFPNKTQFHAPAGNSQIFVILNHFYLILEYFIYVYNGFSSNHPVTPYSLIPTRNTPSGLSPKFRNLIFNLLRQISVDFICIGIGPPNGSWVSYQESHRRRKWTVLPGPAISW